MKQELGYCPKHGNGVVGKSDADGYFHPACCKGMRHKVVFLSPKAHKALQAFYDSGFSDLDVQQMGKILTKETK